MITNYTDFLNEDAPSISNKLEDWLKKGKKGKEVIIYFHDDMDGIFSAIAMKKYLKNHGFKIAGYGVVNYIDGWTTTKLDSSYINIALDYAEDIENIDVYIDHHGKFQPGENFGKASTKTKTGSAYEGILDQLGMAKDEITLDIIDMIDSAKYDDYGVDYKEILKYNEPGFFNKIIKSKLTTKQKKLTIAGAFNQLIKRSDYKTFIEVVHNSDDVSIYRIVKLFKLLYPANNPITPNLKKFYGDTPLKDIAVGGEILSDYGDAEKYVDKGAGKVYPVVGYKDFFKDSAFRLKSMAKRTRGIGKKIPITSSKHFEYLFRRNGKIAVEGYQLIGNLVFVPNATWANALRIRAIFEEDEENKDLPLVKYEIIGKKKKEFLKYYGDRVTVHGKIDRNKNTIDVAEIMDETGEKLGIDGVVLIDFDVNESHSIQTLYEYNLFKSIKDKFKSLKDKFKSKKEVDKPSEKEGEKPDQKEKTKVQKEPEFKESEIDDSKFTVYLEARQPIMWMMLQYGNTLQVASFKKMERYIEEYLPITKDGQIVDDLGKYTDKLLDNFKKYLFYDSRKTKSGGHKGIGSITNIVGEYKDKKYKDVTYTDLFKNKIISDLSGVPWDIGMNWGPVTKVSLPEKVERFMTIDQIRKVTNTDKILEPAE